MSTGRIFLQMMGQLKETRNLWRRWQGKVKSHVLNCPKGNMDKRKSIKFAFMSFYFEKGFSFKIRK
jgi:hypothetical protein